MRNQIQLIIVSIFFFVTATAQAGSSGTWARITELQWNVNGFRVVLDQDIDTLCPVKNIAAIMDPAMDPYQFDVRDELTYKTVVSQLTAAYYENKEIHLYYRDDAKACAFNSFTVLTGFGVR
ncbi:hypothetical protein OAS86_03960 [Gammaproteobacteria bacterium]|nr:hypothetical protein [Gammaproteobacteria bacterium]